jgi:hypothetical protein
MATLMADGQTMSGSPRNSSTHLYSNTDQLHIQKVISGRNYAFQSIQGNQTQPPHPAVSPFKEYKWFNSHNVLQELHCGVRRLELPVAIDINSTSAPHDIWISAQLICYGIPVQEGALSTPFAMSDSHFNAFIWNSMFNFQVKIKDLSADAAIVFTAWDPTDGTGGEIYGTTTLSLFDENGKMKTGQQKLIFNSNPTSSSNSSQSLSREHDQERISNEIKSKDQSNRLRYESYADHDQAFVMERHIKEYEHQAICLDHHLHKYSTHFLGSGSDRKSWLDGLTRTQIEAIFEETSYRGATSSRGIDNSPNSKTDGNLTIYSSKERALRSLFCLIIELPSPPYPILFEEKIFSSVSPHLPPTTIG